jgi:LytS/YehU family sensor histidine kinase
MRIVERYAGIHRLRFGDALDISVGADAEVRSLRVPGVLLQPLVENAVRHAAAAAPGARVRVRAYRDGPQLVLAVANTRAARGAHEGTGSGQAIGLANTRSRLASLYGAAARVDLRDEAEWTVAEIRLPLAPAGAGAARA